MEAPRYTAKEIEDGLYSGMDPDVELVAAQYYDALTAENTELRGKLDDVRMGIGCARGQRTTQYCAEVAQRDAVIAEILAMLKPMPQEKFYTLRYAEDIIHEDCCRELHRRACEIAGRTE